MATSIYPINRQTEPLLEQNLDNTDDEPTPEEVPEPEPTAEWRTYRVQKGDVLGSILPKFGLPTAKIRTAAIDIIDLANLRIGQEFRFQFQPGAETPDEIRFALGEDDTLSFVKMEKNGRRTRKNCSLISSWDIDILLSKPLCGKRRLMRDYDLATSQ